MILRKGGRPIHPPIIDKNFKINYSPTDLTHITVDINNPYVNIENISGLGMIEKKIYLMEHEHWQLLLQLVHH